MALVVQKYGGTSVGDASRIRRVAERVVASRAAGNDVVVVVSAMGDSTDDLIALARRVSPDPPPREMDMLLTAGERISMSLLAMAIADLGVTAKSFTGSQAGIITDTLHGKARILDVRAGRISEALAEGNVVIVAGFQGVSTSRDVTTLGRGGSDTTAVALAAALGAGVCENYTDVDGVYTADPRVVPEARKLHAVSYEEMLELSASGARVLMLRCVEYARRTGMLLHVRSSFTEADGTWVREEDERMEKAIVSGVPHDTSEAKVTLVRVPDKPGIAARLMRGIAEHGVNVDMIVQNVSHGGTTDISFTVPKTDLSGAMAVLEGLRAEATSRTSPTGSSRSATSRRRSSPTAPVAPTITATGRAISPPPGARRCHRGARGGTRPPPTGGSGRGWPARPRRRHWPGSRRRCGWSRSRSSRC